ncbi:MAG: hypothetical protein D6718_12040 [Acidobacteria bacterium]|nr:MAG: hypothetical protein D6718_12040 [Acidobacteriota bacterium]
MRTWKAGDRLTHRFNPELGPGEVIAVEGRTILVRFAGADEPVRLAAASDALVPFVPGPGTEARLGRRPVRVAGVLADGRCALEDGTVVAAEELWPESGGGSLVDRLARGEVDPIDDLANRIDALHLQNLRQADGLGSFLGGRIEIYPHQLHCAERAVRQDPVRWLLADEVGLGKTVEACLIASHLIRTRRVSRVLVVAPETLTIQWLGELWRKFHQVFVLMDDKRLRDVEREHGRAFNPFEAHQRMIVALELLVGDRRLAELAASAGFDLLVVDEAHRLRRPPGHPGNPAYRTVAPLARATRHVLLLTATPLEDDAHGFFRLLQLLRPDEFPEEIDVAQRLAARRPLPPCTSATRRADLGGLAPRVPRPVDLPDGHGWREVERLLGALRSRPPRHEVERRTLASRIEAALSSGPALEARLPADAAHLRRLARAAAREDPRIVWLADQARRWREAGEKALVFVAHRETLEWIREELSRRAQIPTSAFHEQLGAAQRDLEVARFRRSSGPPILVSTECGGEGRNFQFCTRIVLFDLPWNPQVVEQRIGRLDRIGRRDPVEIVYFRPPGGLGASIVRLYERLGLFERPAGGLVRELSPVATAIAQAAVTGCDEIEPALVERLARRAHGARSRIEAAAFRELHREPYRPELAGGILRRVPAELESLTQEVILSACERLGFEVEPLRDGRSWSIRLGTRAAVESLPGVPSGSEFTGTFDRSEAVVREHEDFFASGHPLVEGVLAEILDGPRGRVGLIHVSGQGERGFGLLAFYRRGSGFVGVAVDNQGRRRPDWVARFGGPPLRSRRVDARDWVRRPAWEPTIRRLAAMLPDDMGPPVALAALRVG